MILNSIIISVQCGIAMAAALCTRDETNDVVGAVPCIELSFSDPTALIIFDNSHRNR